MKKIIMLLLSFIPILATAQKENITWNFPIKPGSEEWLKISEFENRLSLLNIPDAILKTISTEELVKSCLTYPEFRLIFSRNDLQSGYNYIRSMFNGFRELETRPDAGKELIKIYKHYSPDGFDLSLPDVEIGRFMMNFSFIEILMAQNEIQSKLTLSDSKELMSFCSQKYKVKKNLQKYYGGIGLQTTALIISRQQSKKLLNTKLKYGDQKINAFNDKLFFDNIELLDDIVSENDKILQNGL